MNAFDSVFKLLSRGANINQQNKEGRTALTLAIMEDDFLAI